MRTPTKDLVHKIVKESPGLGGNEINQKLMQDENRNVSYHTVMYHLRNLEDNKKIYRIETGEKK